MRERERREQIMKVCTGIAIVCFGIAATYLLSDAVH